MCGETRPVPYPTQVTVNRTATPSDSLKESREETDLYRPLRDDPAYARYDIGPYSYGIPTIHHWGRDAKLKIGKFCSIAEVDIYLGGNHRNDFVTTFPLSELFTTDQPNSQIPTNMSTNGDVIIGNDVWIGNDALILSGVKIGDRAVIGARTVVSRDVPPYAVFVGNPGQTRRMRFNEAVIERLLEIRWWDWDIEKIRRYADLLQSANIERFGSERGTPAEFFDDSQQPDDAHQAKARFPSLPPNSGTNQASR